MHDTLCICIYAWFTNVMYSTEVHILPDFTSVLCISPVLPVHFKFNYEWNSWRYMISGQFFLFLKSTFP